VAEPVIPTPAGVFGGVVQSAGTLGINNDILKLDYEDRFYLYDRNVTPILAILTQRTPSSSVKEVLYKWFEDQPIPEWLGLAGAIGSTTQQTIPLTTGQGAWCQVGDIILESATGEMMQVLSISVDTLTVTRGVNGTTAANLGATDQLLNLKTPWGQGTQKASPYSTNPTSVFNYAQIYKNDFSLAKSLQAAATYGGDQRSYQRFKLMQAHARAWEQIFLHSLRSANTATATPTYTTGGLDYYIKSNILAVGGPMAESDFIEFITRVNRYSVDGGGSDNKILFASRAVCNAINSWGLAKLHMNDGLSQKYGVTITTYSAAGINLNIVLHPLLEQGYDGYAYLLDMNGIKRRVFRPTTLVPDIQPPGADFYQDECITEQGFEVNMEKAHGIITGVTF
jgi:hypothetical protein